MEETSNKYDISNFLKRMTQHIIFVIPGFNPTMYGPQICDIARSNIWTFTQIWGDHLFAVIWNLQYNRAVSICNAGPRRNTGLGWVKFCFWNKCRALNREKHGISEPTFFFRVVWCHNSVFMDTVIHEKKGVKLIPIVQIYTPLVTSWSSAEI